MQGRRKRQLGGLAAVVLVASGVLAGTALAGVDWGQKQQSDTEHHSTELFGVKEPLAASSTDDVNDPGQAQAHPDQLFSLAKGLTARVLTSMTEAGKMAAPNVDMIALWPDDAHPTTLVFCNEQGTADPGVQRLDLATGAVTTIVTGTTSCDPVHRTAWGTLVFGEEAGTSGGLYELIDPLHTEGVTLDRVAHTTSGGTGAGNIAYRGALGNLSFEGVAVYGNGVVYYGDENRPSAGNPGAIYKSSASASGRFGARGGLR